MNIPFTIKGLKATVIIVLLTGLCSEEGRRKGLGANGTSAFSHNIGGERAKLLQQNEELMVTQESSFSATSLLLSRGLTNDTVSLVASSLVFASLGLINVMLPSNPYHFLSYPNRFSSRCRMSQTSIAGFMTHAWNEMGGPCRSLLSYINCEKLQISS